MLIATIEAPIRALARQAGTAYALKTSEALRDYAGDSAIGSGFQLHSAPAGTFLMLPSYASNVHEMRAFLRHWRAADSVIPVNTGTRPKVAVELMRR